jgi:protein SCO1/2
MNRTLAAALLGLALLVAAFISLVAEPGPSTPPAQQRAAKYDGTTLVPPQPRPTLTLTDTNGKRFAFGTATATHPTFLYFGYTNCPDVCPETMADIGIALTKVPPALARQTYVVFVTTDLRHDTRPVIKRWLANFSDGSKATWVGLRGTQEQIDAAQAAAHIPLATDDGRTHSAQALLYGTDDSARVTFLQSTDEQQAMAHDLPLVARDRG